MNAVAHPTVACPGGASVLMASTLGFDRPFGPQAATLASEAAVATVNTAYENIFLLHGPTRGTTRTARSRIYGPAHTVSSLSCALVIHLVAI